MGNCCLERPRRGGGGSAGAVHYARTNPVWVDDNDVGDRKEEARKQGKGEGEGEGAGAPAATTEVKIRITRKQLEELLRRVEGGKHDGGGGGGGAPIQEVISELLCVASTSSNFRHREEGQQWRPSLQTIPE